MQKQLISFAWVIKFLQHFKSKGRRIYPNPPPCVHPDPCIQTILLLHLIKIFQYDLKCNNFTHGKLPHKEKRSTTNPCHCSWEIPCALKCKIYANGKMTHPFHEIQHGCNHSKNAPGANPKGDDWCNRPPKTHKSNSIHHDFIQFSKQHSWYKAILLSSVSSQKCCEVYFISCSSEPLMIHDYQILQISPLPLTFTVCIHPWNLPCLNFPLTMYSLFRHIPSGN